jgi:protein-tyrosine phosphatase
VIDIHSHLLPGVDDGSADIATSVEVLERFAKHGLEVLICTPHLAASHAEHAP